MTILNSVRKIFLSHLNEKLQQLKLCMKKHTFHNRIVQQLKQKISFFLDQKWKKHYSQNRCRFLKTYNKIGLLISYSYILPSLPSRFNFIQVQAERVESQSANKEIFLQPFSEDYKVKVCCIRFEKFSKQLCGGKKY